MKKNKLTLYLIKSEFQSLDDIVESASSPHVIPGIGSFIFKESVPHRPSWIADFFGGTLEENMRILGASPKGVLIVPVRDGEDTVNFALSFGTGRHLLKEGVVEERFGLKVVLNSIGQGNIRSIYKTTLGSVPKHSREQMSREARVADFGIDIEQDLISSITAISQDEMLGKRLTGGDSLSLTVKSDINSIKELLMHCLERHESSDYKREFDWIDQISEVRNKRIENQLNALLITKLNARELEKVWMAVPEVIDWVDVKGFRYLRTQRATLEEDLDATLFLNSLGSDTLTIDVLKSRKIFMIAERNEEVDAQWSAFRCFYAEIELNGKFYVLNNGKWYEIAQGFTEQVKNDFNRMPQSDIELPDCVSNNEGIYNKSTASNASGIYSMDKELIPHGGGHSKIEFCDLFTSDKKIVHVKRYGGSSMLSHLFAQGVVSGELFVSDIDFRKKLNTKLPPSYKLTDTNSRPNTADYEVVYAIISKSENPLDIPFFSKVSLRNARRRLQSYGYKVSIKKVKKIANESSEQS